MSGELQVVFVYDTQCCKREEDDPSDAILYFHPSDVGEEERIAICGQLMGVTQFFIINFACPRILTLENGKFALKQFGRYILVIGCNSVTPDWLLQQQSNILECLIQFYHKDFDTILTLADKDGDKFRAKLDSLFEVYLPLSQYHGDLFALTFGIIPALSLPKSAKNIFLEATQILQSCQRRKGVLGGTIIFCNKVVSTVLNAELTKRVAFFEPHRNLLLAEHIKTNFVLPIGVKLLQVYLLETDVKQLRRGSCWYKDIKVSRNLLRTKTVRQQEWEKRSRVGLMSVRNEAKSVLPITEEDEYDGLVTNTYTHLPAEDQPVTDTLSAVVNRLATLLVTEQNSVANGDHSVSGVRSKKRYNGTEQEMALLNLLSPTQQSPSHIKLLNIKNSTTAENDIIRFGTNTTLDKYANKSFSLDDLREKNVSQQNPFRFYSFGLPSVSRNCKKQSHSPGDDCKRGKKWFHNSVADPWSPIFRSDGIVVSKYLYEQFVDETANLWRGMISSCPSPDGSLSEDSPPEVTKLKEKKNNIQLQKQSMSLPLTSTTKEQASSEDKFVLPLNRKEVDQVNGVDENHSVSSGETPLLNKEEVKSQSFLDTFRRISNVQQPSPMISCHPLVGSDEYEEGGKETGELCNVALYAQIHMNMLLLLLLETDTCKEADLMQALWETGLSTLGSLEVNIRGWNDHGGGEQDDVYSYLSYDPSWASLCRGGRKENMNLDVVQTLHQAFITKREITELTIRCEDHVVYGHHCGGSEVFYQQSSGPRSGLPVPSDIMGKVPLKARRRLERDHNIVIL